MKIVALAGGVGGAKLADGLARTLAPDDLTVIVNTGDDFEHWGLCISPDLDTVCYTLAGLANPVTGWGRQNETFQALDAVRRLGGPDWFAIGDQDLGTHLERTRLLREGQSLSQVTREFCRAWGVGPTVLPMSDQPVRTMVDTLEYGELSFQEYFVHLRCEPKIKSFRFTGIEQSVTAPGCLEAIEAADAVIFCPSNPWVSLDPILAVPGMREAVQVKPVLAVSPIIGGETVKGPAAKMFRELGLPATAAAVAQHYGDLLLGFVLDTVDKDLAKEIAIPTLVTNTVMKTFEDRQRLAEDVLHLAQV